MTEKHSTKPPRPSLPCPHPPLKIWLLTAAISTAYELSSSKNDTVNRCLLSYLDPLTAPNLSPVCHVATSSIVVDPSRNLYFRLLLPDNPNKKKEEKLPTVVVFYGGRFAMLSPASWGYDAVCRRFARLLFRRRRRGRGICARERSLNTLCLLPNPISSCFSNSAAPSFSSSPIETLAPSPPLQSIRHFIPSPPLLL